MAAPSFENPRDPFMITLLPLTGRAASLRFRGLGTRDRASTARSACALVLLSVIGASGCATPVRAHWRAGIAPLNLEASRPARRPEDVKVYYKQSFSLFEEPRSRRAFACSSVTLLRRAELVPGRTQDPPPDKGRVRIAELATEEFPRDDEKSRIEDPSFRRILGFGPDDADLFTVAPLETSVTRGIARLRQLAAELGADAVEDVFMTVHAEHQMWEGFAISLNPRSTRSPVFVGGRLLDFRVRDVRFHGTAVIHEE